MHSRLVRLVPILAFGLLLVAVPVAHAGSSEDPEIKDALKDEATEPGGVLLCTAGVCPPAFATYPGDIEQAWVGPEDGAFLHFNLQVNGSAESGGSSSMEWTWTLHWTLDGVESAVAATMTTSGTVSCGGLATSCGVNSTASGVSRVFTFTVPKAALGDPPKGAILTAIWAESHGRPQASMSVAAGAADRAPDAGYGSDYAMLGPPVVVPPNGTTNRSVEPAPGGHASDEARASPGPLPGVLALGLLWAARFRSRRRRAGHSAPMRSSALAASFGVVLVGLAGCIQVELGAPVAAPQELPADTRYTGPVVDFTWSPSAPSAGQEVTFTPVVKVLKGTGISSYSWSFGDGWTSKKGEAKHTFLSPGVMTVTLAVRSSDGLAGQGSRVVPVASSAAGASGSSTSPPQQGGGDAAAPASLPEPVIATIIGGQTVRFSYTWSAQADSVGWDFGDGTSSNEAAPEHTYALAGAYQVALHVLRGSEVHSTATTVVAGTPYRFVQRAVTAAVSYTNDLYEPTIEVSDTGALYITGHTILVDTTGAPAFVSHDDGLTWTQMPFLSDLALPAPLPGATPPPSDEMFLIAGDDGWVYGVDITLATFPVNAWSGDGTALRYHNPNAYDESDAAGCIGVPVKDRPWGAYAAGTLLMVNNPAGGRAQVGVLRVPPELPAGAGLGTAQWNLCAGPGGSIPGIPDLREDGLFAVPQIDGDDRFTLTLGNVANVREVKTVALFDVGTGGEITSVYGIAAFDAAGTLFAGISNNPEGGDAGGAVTVAASTDGGQSFSVRTFATGDKPLRHFYMDPNDVGTGALVVWAVDGSGAARYDWYTAHVQLAGDGGPRLENILLAIDEGPKPSAHVTGAAVGPDGRAYLAMYEPDGILGTPLSVFVQLDGPTLPAAAATLAP